MSTQPFLPADWDLPKSLYYRLGYGPGRQRVLEQDDHVLLVLHDPPAHLDRDRTGRLFWIQPEGEWRASYSNDGQQALERHLDRYEKRIDKLSEQLEAANDSEHYFATLGELGPLVRSTNNLSQALQEARKLRKEDRLLMEARDRAYALHRRVDLLQQDAKNSLDYEMAKQAESQAKSSHQMAVSAHRLNMLAAFFFPLATLSAIFGMTFTHGLEDWDRATAPLAFITLLAIGLLLGAGLIAVGHQTPIL